MEDDEEDAPLEPPREPTREARSETMPEPQREARPVRRQIRRPSGIEIQQENLRKIILSRQKPKDKPRKAPEPRSIDPQQILLIQQKAQMLIEPKNLAIEFLNLKHGQLDEHIWDCGKITAEFRHQYGQIIRPLIDRLERLTRQAALANSMIESEYCQIKFRQLPMLQQEVAHQHLKITELRLSLNKLRRARVYRAVQSSAAFIRKAQNFLDTQYIKPRKSARAKIDKLLGYSENLHQQYAMLQAKGEAILRGSFEMDGHMSFLEDSPSKKWIRKFTKAWAYHRRQLSLVLHIYRSKWLLEQRRRSPLAVASLWDLSDFSRVMAEGQVLFHDAKWTLEAIMLPSMGPRRDKIRAEKQSLSNYLRKVYNRQYKVRQRKGSPFKNRHWRQLDVMAAFHTLLMHDWWVRCEAIYLLRTLSGNFGPMWTNLTEEERKRHGTDIFHWVKEHLRHRKELVAEVNLLAEVNWLRLEIEEKLHRLGEYNDILARELFVPVTPLSENPKAFQHWTRNLAAIAGDGWFVQKITSFSEDRESLSNVRTLFPVLTEKRHVELQRLSYGSTEDLVANPAIGAPRIPGEPQQLGVSQTKPKLKSRHMKHARGGQKQPARSLRKTVAKTSIEPDSVSAQQSNSNPEQNTQQAGSGSHRRIRRHWKISRVPESSKRSFSTGPLAVRRNAQESNDESLQMQSQARGAPPIETSLGDLVHPAENDLGRETATADASAPLFWRHSEQVGPDGQKITVHYCRTLQSTEEIARLFLGSKVIGFDMEWKAQASATDTIQNNLSLIQIANEDRIALFQVALFKPARGLEDFVAPSLKLLLESQDVIKVGVSIKADSTRLRKYLGIDARSIFELSHLYKLVKYGQTSPKLVNKRAVNLSDQIEEHLGLPLEKSDDIRCGDWTRPLNYRQVQCKSTRLFACMLGSRILIHQFHRCRH